MLLPPPQSPPGCPQLLHLYPTGHTIIALVGPTSIWGLAPRLPGNTAGLLRQGLCFIHLDQALKEDLGVNPAPEGICVLITETPGR